MHRSLLFAVLSLSILLSALVAAQDTSYTFTTIDVPFPGATSTAARALNSRGQIAGNYGSIQGGRGFLYAAGTFTTIHVPSADNTDLTGINDRGHLVGSYNRRIGTDLRQGGFLYAAGVFTLLDVPGATYTQTLGINNLGHIVGVFGDATTPQQGFLFDGDTFTPLPVTVAWGLNDAGQIVGHTASPTEPKVVGFLLDAGVLTILDVPGSIQTVACGINHLGQIAGTYSDARAVGHGFLYTDGTFTTIDVPGAEATETCGLNSRGQLAGIFYEADFSQHGFVATPTKK